jgi:hypothetical protein
MKKVDTMLQGLQELYIATWAYPIHRNSNIAAAEAEHFLWSLWIKKKRILLL